MTVNNSLLQRRSSVENTTLNSKAIFLHCSMIIVTSVVIKSTNFQKKNTYMHMSNTTELHPNITKPGKLIKCGKKNCNIRYMQGKINENMYIFTSSGMSVLRASAVVPRQWFQIDSPEHKVVEYTWADNTDWKRINMKKKNHIQENVTVLQIIFWNVLFSN